MHPIKFLFSLLCAFALIPTRTCFRISSAADDNDASSGSSRISSTVTTGLESRQLVVSKRGTSEAGYHSKKEGNDFAEACYREPLPDIPMMGEERSVPWGSPVIEEGGKRCCSSLEEVRQGIDAVDKQLLVLLAKRAAYVREATRFKPTHGTVDVPERDRQVIERAVADAPQYHLPQLIARNVYTAIINGSVNFELCVFDSYGASVE